MSEPLVMDRQDAVAIIAINDAPYNRMSLEFIDQLEVLIGEIAGKAWTRTGCPASARRAKHNGSDWQLPGKQP